MGDEDSGYGGEEQASGGILRVVWFRQMLHRWQSSSTAAVAVGSTSASASDTAEGARGTSTDKQGNIDGETAAEEEEDDGTRKPAAAAGRLPRLVVVEESSPSLPTTPVEPPPDVPRGCCAVYVGAERRRFVVPTAYLCAPVFARLLEKAEEEFGFDYHGAGITIPCDTEAFKYILVAVEAHWLGLVDEEGNPKVREEGAPQRLDRHLQN